MEVKSVPSAFEFEFLELNFSFPLIFFLMFKKIKCRKKFRVNIRVTKQKQSIPEYVLPGCWLWIFIHWIFLNIRKNSEEKKSVLEIQIQKQMAQIYFHKLSSIKI